MLKLTVLSALVLLCACTPQALPGRGPFAPAMLDLAQSGAVVRSFRLPAVNPPGGAQADALADFHGGVWVLTFDYKNGLTIRSYLTHVSAAGKSETYRIPSDIAFASSIAIGPNGEVYFPGENGHAIGGLIDGRFRRYTTPSKYPAPTWVFSASDGAFFTQYNGRPHGAIGKIQTSGRMVQYPLPGGHGLYPAFLQDDGDGGVWFVATGIYNCVNCPTWIGHAHKGGTLDRYWFKLPAPGSVHNVVLANGTYWFGANDAGKAGVGYVGANRARHTYVLSREPLAAAFPLGMLGGKLWSFTTSPFALWSSAGDTRPQRLRVRYPVNPLQTGYTVPAIGKRYLWLVEANGGTGAAAFAYRYDPATGNFRSAYLSQQIARVPTAVDSGNTLWFVSGQHLWSVAFP